jgi:hypothetical protein
MKMLLFRDNTLEINLAGVRDGINSTNTAITCELGKSAFAIPTRKIANPGTYERLPETLVAETDSADLAVLCTSIPYDNNFFFESSSRVVILSFFSWEHLTSLPVENGLVYFISTLVMDRLPISISHERNTGCINDFLGDKTGVDIGMRSAFVCQRCLDRFEEARPTGEHRELLKSLRRVLDDLSRASRSNLSVVEAWQRQEHQGFEVFLCHNSADKPEVRRVAKLLKASGIRPWLDEEQLRPGLPWQVALEEQIATIGSTAVFVGASNLGPWQSMELRAFLDEFVRRRSPVIPVLLPNATSPPDLPLFLRQMTWVDFRKDDKRALKLLAWGITGNKPEGIDS